MPSSDYIPVSATPVCVDCGMKRPGMFTKRFRGQYWSLRCIVCEDIAHRRGVERWKDRNIERSRAHSREYQRRTRAAKRNQ